MPALITKLEASVPLDIRAAAEETIHGWRRLCRFQISMLFPTLKTSATYLGLLPSMLTLQLDQLECAVGAELFHRSVRHTPQKPTRRGARLLQDLDRDDVQKLMHDALGSKIEAIPDQDTVDAAIAVVDGERGALTSLPSHFRLGERIHIPPPVLPLLEHLLAHAGRVTHAGQIQNATGIPFNTVCKQLKRMEAAGWLTSRLETRTERPGAARRRTYYSLTAAAHQTMAHDPNAAPMALRKRTAPRDRTNNTEVGPDTRNPRSGGSSKCASYALSSLHSR
ncbi:hypothetical protein [Streptomyces sp. NPDC002666]